MPTYNRRDFVPHAIRYFLRQQYPNKELIIVDDGSDCIEDLIPVADNIRYYRLSQKITLGAKLNLACEYAKGDVIANWDDDDWYAPNRLCTQIEALQQPKIEVCGINQLLYYDLPKKQAYLYRYPADQKIWLIGSSLCFTKTLWSLNKFAEIQVGMDGLFVWATPSEKVKAIEDYHFSVHLIHSNNVSPKNTENIWWHPHSIENLQNIMKNDWAYYAHGNVPIEFIKNISPELSLSDSKHKQVKTLKNIFACLVHENESCILDLVQNLHYNDPSSIILLYNGSENSQLIQNLSDLESYNVVIHPQPQPQKHGYLHTFALDCMSYALENFSFDTFTIVDSDQLCLKPGYSQYLTDFFSYTPNIGLLSSKPERVNADNKTNHIALQAFKEYDLWKPLLDSFPDGNDKFVHWTFWPSTVFSQPAIHDLIKLFTENTLLQEIMKHTKIWATEEVIFPTLVSLLGYEIAQNPCSYEFVKYKKYYSFSDIDRALQHPSAYWVHPVERDYDNPIRKNLRDKFNFYKKNEKINQSMNTSSLLLTNSLITKSKQIEGWLSDNEADLLIATAVKACINSPAPLYIVEIGSYHGRSTVLLGNVAKSLFPEAKVYAIDPHDGIVGDKDQELKSTTPTLEIFRQNIKNEGLCEVVELIKDFSFNVKWQMPISMIFIDGLHDYYNVSRDFWHFSVWINQGGYIVFHDYADYYPGVILFVDQLLESRDYEKIHKVDSMIVLRKL